MDTLAKLDILAEAARYDVACTSSGASRPAKAGKLGNASPAGCCHSFTPDGRCVTLLKVLMSNACSYDCAYCVNRRQASCPRATFAPRELAELTVDFYKRNYIEGLFLSSGVLGTPDATTERMIECLRILRDERLQSAVRGLYPCGEGAGYAGGITSAAVDGLRCAEAVLRDLT